MVVSYFDTSNSPVVEMILYYPFSRGESRSSERLSDLPEVTQLESAET